MPKQHTTSIWNRLDALRQLWTLSDDEYHAFMGTYTPLFGDSPENTLADYEAGVPVKGYTPGSSKELEHYYKIIHLLCTLGSVEKMYMPPELDPDKSVMENQLLLERMVARELGVGPGDQVIELGCGCGAIAAHIQDVSGAELHGINIDPSQIRKAHRNRNLRPANFQVADFNKPLPFPDESFDGVYAIQPMTYIADMAFTVGEIWRILKPGARFVMNDVAALDAYDRNNPEHRTLIQHTRELTAFGGFWHYRYWEDAFQDAGFELKQSLGRSAVGLIRKEVALYDRIELAFNAASSLRLMPRKLYRMVQRMHANAESYIRAEELELISLNWFLVAEKPA